MNRILGLAVAAALVLAAPAAAQTAATPATLDRVFDRIYNFDFQGAHRVLDVYVKEQPQDPLGHSVRAAIYMFTEFDRLHILDTEFFMVDEKLIDDGVHKNKPDPELRKKLFAAIDEARRRAQARLAADPNDRDALLASCMAANVVMDYTVLVERHRWQGISLARQSVAYANKLVALNPPCYDGFNTIGALEYIVGSMPFYVRWFIHYDKLENDKRKGIETVKLVARHGRFYKPFARVLLAVASLREQKLEDARQWLTGLVGDYPENPLFKRELQRVTTKLATRNGK